MTPDTLAHQRQEWRKERIATRKSMPADVRTVADAALNAQLRACLNDMAGGVLAFYWPIQAEFDARPAVTEWLAGSGQSGDERRAVLPVVIGKDQPLRFRAWHPDTVMQPAGFGTSVPSTGEWLTPTVLLIPLVGFDDAGYRLGYGGGYYDRTLAALQPRARTIGIGYAAGKLATIYPQSYDLKLDTLLTA